MTWEERRIRELSARVSERDLWIERLERDLAKANEAVTELRAILFRAAEVGS